MTPSLSALGKAAARRLGVVTPQARARERVAGLWKLADTRDWDALASAGRAELSSDGRNAEVMSLVAYALLGQGRFVESAQLAAEAAQIDPDRYLAAFTAGAASSALGQHVDARNFMRKAHALSPTDPEAIRRLIVAIAAVDGLEAAAQEFQLISSLNSTPTEVVIAPVRSVTSWATEHGLPILGAGEIEQIPFVRPRIWGEPEPTTTTIALGNTPYVAELADVRVFGNSTIILTNDGVALSDPAADPRFGFALSFEYEPIVLAQHGDRVLLSTAGIGVTRLEAGVLLCGLASNYYGHWLPDFLPRLQFLSQHPEFASLPIIVDAGMPQSHFDHLSRLCKNPVIRLEAGESLECGKLLVASSPTFFPVELLPNDIPVETMPGLSMRAMRYLRGEGIARSGGPGTRRLFLARRQMKWRRLINEDEIAAELGSLGFESAFLEELTAAQQIQLFSEAEWIVAPNGSALLNVIFAPTSVKVLVLTQPNLFNWGTFQGPMDALGYESCCVRGEFAVSEAQKHSDYRVPVDRVREALLGMGLTVGTGSGEIAD